MAVQGKPPLAPPPGPVRSRRRGLSRDVGAGTSRRDPRFLFLFPARCSPGGPAIPFQCGGSWDFLRTDAAGGIRDLVDLALARGRTLTAPAPHPRFRPSPASYEAATYTTPVQRAGHPRPPGHLRHRRTTATRAPWAETGLSQHRAPLECSARGIPPQAPSSRTPPPQQTRANKGTKHPVSANGPHGEKR